MLRFLSTLTFMVFFWPLVDASEDSCDCPEVKCENPCEEQTGITFYTEKCQQGKKVKSCAKPTCIIMETANEACFAYQKSLGKNRAVASTKKSEDTTSKFIEPSSSIGSIQIVKGQAWLKNEMGGQRVINLGMEVRENDTLITSAAGRLTLKLNNGNVIHVLPNSLMKMSEVDLEGRKTLIDLQKGQLRTKVNQKLGGANSYFKIRTRSAVAGVRGTDFVVSYEVTQKAVTKVQTFEGAVELASSDLTKRQKILAGQESSFVVAANTTDTDVFSDDEINDFIARGYMTPVYKMSESEIKKLKWETDAANEGFARRSLANKMKEKFICSEPKALLNQCHWRCENNPKGEKRCRTDLPYVNCVRKLCNANGQWSDETRLPSTFFDKCHPQEIKVGPCDY